MVVDNQTTGSLRLRAWNKGSLLTQTPDMEITGGKKEVQGTGPCTHAVWSFQAGATKYLLSERRACYPDSNEPPLDALGQFTRHTSQQDESWSWC